MQYDEDDNEKDYDLRGKAWELVDPKSTQTSVSV